MGPAMLALAIAAAPAQAAVPDWLAGSWISETREGWTEEHWMAPRGGVMLGLNRSGKGEKVSGFEFMRIVCEERCTFYASPSGQAPVAFREAASEGRGQQLVLENPANDFPKRIVYRREGNRLLATISGAGGANSISWTFRRK